MKIEKHETEIVGHWILNGIKVVADENCRRIDWLRANHLQLLSVDESGWIKLYQDPDDRRYWQLNFEHGELQGGGPPSLMLLSEFEAKSKYKM